jgi:3-oxoacyl-[acyl-carrier protein] reductase
MASMYALGMDLGLADKVALITGGSGLIGFEIAHRLGLEGARVAICARNPERLELATQQLSASGIEVFSFVADVQQPQEVSALLEAVVARFGGLDVLVNGPGGVWQGGSFSEVELDSWRAGFELNVVTTASVSRVAFPLLRARPWGRVINLGAFYAAPMIPDLFKRFAENAVAKTALSSLTKVMAEEFAPSITVNCIAPGPVGEDHPMREETRAFPIPRPAHPEEVAALAAFLCSSHAGYITGLTIPFDGGADRRVI